MFTINSNRARPSPNARQSPCAAGTTRVTLWSPGCPNAHPASTNRSQLNDPPLPVFDATDADLDSGESDRAPRCRHYHLHADDCSVSIVNFPSTLRTMCQREQGQFHLTTTSTDFTSSVGVINDLSNAGDPNNLVFLSANSGIAVDGLSFFVDRDNLTAETLTLTYTAVGPKHQCQPERVVLDNTAPWTGRTATGPAINITTVKRVTLLNRSSAFQKP